jgi:hypothetical protein
MTYDHTAASLEASYEFYFGKRKIMKSCFKILEERGAWKLERYKHGSSVDFIVYELTADGFALNRRRFWYKREAVAYLNERAPAP